MKVALIAGEASGDLLAADLMAALKTAVPGVRFIGMGGPRMQAQGLDSWFDYKTLSVMGLVEVLKHLPELLRLRRQLLQRLREAKPDVVIGVDAPDFNLGLEKRCRRAGLRTVHFVSPSVWAWREKRAAGIGQSADLVLCLFPMEPPIYRRYGVASRFVGHPLADSIALEPDGAAAQRRLALAPGKALAILPGSRLSEINRLLPDFLAAAALLQERIPGLQLLIPAVNAPCRAAIEGHCAARPLPHVRLLDGQAQDAMLAADAVLLASGTAALEAMLCKKPMAVAYRISPLTYRIVNALGLLKVNRFSLPNVLSGQDLVPELIQDACRPDAIAASLLPMLERDGIAPALLERFRQIHIELRQDAARQAADAVRQLVTGGGA